MSRTEKSRKQLREYYETLISRQRKRWPWYLGNRFFRLLTTKENIFFACLFGLCAKFMQADGESPAEELSTFEAFLETTFHLQPKEKVIVLRRLRDERRSGHSFDYHARRYYRLYQNNPAMLENMYDLLLSIAFADGTLHPREKTLIDAARNIFHLPPDIVKQVEARQETIRKIRETMHEELSDLHTAPPRQTRTKRAQEEERDQNESRPRPSQDSIFYILLGCTAADSDDQIKTKYRALVMKYHPDRLQGSGMPKELWQTANERFQRIQEAYDGIKKQRGMK